MLIRMYLDHFNFMFRYGGASIAAAFLQNFVEKDVKWAHIDIAG